MAKPRSHRGWKLRCDVKDRERRDDSRGGWNQGDHRCHGYACEKLSNWHVGTTPDLFRQTTMYNILFEKTESNMRLPKPILQFVDMWVRKLQCLEKGVGTTVTLVEFLLGVRTHRPRQFEQDTGRLSTRSEVGSAKTQGLFLYAR